MYIGSQSYIYVWPRTSQIGYLHNCASVNITGQPTLRTGKSSKQTNKRKHRDNTKYA